MSQERNAATVPDFETLQVELGTDGIAHVRLNRPDKANAMNRPLWAEFREAMDWIDRTQAARVAVISANGRHFTAGIDLDMFAETGSAEAADEGRRREALRREILELQETFTAIERCRKPVLAAVHSACVGAGIDMISACDMRYASADAYFSVREIDVGMVADVGTLQRLPRIIPDGLARELAYTGRTVEAEEAQQIGLVNRVHADRETLIEDVTAIAAQIAAKSPLSIRGIKEVMLYSRDHSVADGLDYVATWNAGMLLSDDIEEALTARMEKREPRFHD